MTFKRLILTSAGILFFMSSAGAQSVGQRIAPEQANGMSRQESMVRIQSNVSYFVSGPTGDGEDAQKLRERANRSIYEMAARECDTLREVLAKDCRLDSINVNINVNRQFGMQQQQQQDGYSVNGTMSFQITLK